MDKNKQALLDKTFADINKRFGKGTVMSMKDKKIEPIDVIPTGSYLLDRALGCGGWPKGRIVEIYGAESSGKCLTEDSYILTSNGYKQLGDIFKEVGLTPSAVHKTVEMKYPLINMNGREENTTHFTFNGKRPTREIMTSSGNLIKCTYNHPLRVLNSIGYQVWKKAGEIEVGDVLVSLIGTDCFGHINTEEAYVLGAIMAGRISKNSVTIKCPNSEVFEEVMKDIKKVFPKDIMKFDGLSVIISGNWVQYFKTKYGQNNEICVPNVIMMGDELSQQNFLKGFFDCKASNGNGEVTISNYRMAKEIKLMLANMGIQSTISKKSAKSWRMYITGEDFNNLIVFIGSASTDIYLKRFKNTTNNPSRKIPNIADVLISYYENIPIENRSRATDRIISDIKSGKSCGNTSIIHKLLELPCQNNDVKNHLLELANENIVYETVVSNEKGETVPTFDFAMEETHSFICESIVNHNTTVALHAIAEVQKQGGVGAIVDVEHALDPAYAAALGVNLDELILSQPDCGEDALEITESLVRSGVVDLVVIDSVAALTPRAEIDGDMGDAHVGLLARLMSQAMRKLTAAASKSGTTLIFINQIREKVGVMYGNPETTTGGRALKFYSSVRVELRKGETLKNGAEMYGHKLKAKIVKNKIAPPYKSTEMTVIWGKGIDAKEEILDLALADGIIEKGGAWFTYGDQKFQGRDNVKKYFDEHKDEFDKLAAKVTNKNITDFIPTQEEENDEYEDDI